MNAAGAFLAGVWRELNAPEVIKTPLASPGPGAAAESVVEAVLDVLDSRSFCHLSRTQARPYRSRMRPSLLADVQAGRPLRFCYDLGPGYHAGLQADCSDLRFAPGLGELLALRQVQALARAVRPLYAPGVRFALVIDDLCAWQSNDVPLQQTAAYVLRLAGLVAATGWQDEVAVLAESACLRASDYRLACEALALDPWTEPVGEAELDNVSRFVGHVCTVPEAAEHLARYRRAQTVSAALMAPHLPGVRLTQRATPLCLGFRCFPGADVRLQSGEVDLVQLAGRGLRPALITRRNRALYRRWPVGAGHLPPGWPLPAGTVHLALAHGVGGSTT